MDANECVGAKNIFDRGVVPDFPVDGQICILFAQNLHDKNKFHVTQVSFQFQSDIKFRLGHSPVTLIAYG